MAVSGKTAAPYEIPFYLPGDKPPDMAAVTKAMAEREHALLEERDAKIQSGGVAKHLFLAEATREGTAYGSLSTPARVTLPVVKAGQTVEVRCFAFVKNTVAATYVRLLFAGGRAAGEVPTAGPGSNYTILASDAPLYPLANLGEVSEGAVPEFVATMESGVTAISGVPMGYYCPADVTNFSVELQSKISTGKSTLKGIYLMARAVG